MIETKKIFLTGGGTGGSATPLIAIAEKLHQSNNIYKLDWFWLGSRSGLEKAMVEQMNRSLDFKIKYLTIANGKFRRYFSWQNIFDLFLIFAGFWQALFLLLKYRPDLILSAGSYISVPVVWAGWILRIPALIHQQDYEPGLANKLMAPFCRTITVTFEKSLRDYKNAVLTGNMIRPEIVDFYIDKNTARQKVGLTNGLPIIFAIGGGTGADFINRLITDNLPSLTKFCQIVHVTGKDRDLGAIPNEPNYRRFEFLHIDGLIKAYAAADAIITRAGMGVLSEIAWLKKAAIVIPIADSHQEANALALSENDAAIVLDQNTLTGDIFISQLRQLLKDEARRENLGSNLKSTIRIDSQNKIIDLIQELIN